MKSVTHPCTIILNLAFIINTQGSYLLLEIHNTSATTKTRVAYINSYLAYVQIQVHKLHQRYILTGFHYTAVFAIPVPCKQVKGHHDTLDPAILLRRLESTFGISGVALSWFESYLSDRTQSVMVDGLMSTPIPLVFGVPQGSVLGPVLFTLYSQTLSDVIACHSCDYHKHADDTEISDSAPPSDFTSAQSNIRSCMSDTLSWMQSNKLKLNTEKNEMMLVGSSVRISSVGCECRYRWKLHLFFRPPLRTLECILTKRCQ